MVSETQQGMAQKSKVRSMLPRALQLGAFLLLMGLILFLGSGDAGWINAWALLGIYLGVILCNAFIFLPRDTGLIEERAQIKANVKSWDKVISGLYGLVGMLGTLAAAALDHRWSGSPDFSLVLVILGGILYAGGYALASWAMITNRFFSTYVRIQSERGHTVVDQGPYRLVRHPGYLGMLVTVAGTILLLESLWALAPAILGLGLLVTRTALEDRTLQNELPGYREFTNKVPYRLFPGLW